MYRFCRGDSLYKEIYNWGREPGDTPATGRDSSRLDRSEGYEVIALINTVLGSLSEPCKELAQSLEKYLHESIQEKETNRDLILQELYKFGRMVSILRK